MRLILTGVSEMQALSFIRKAKRKTPQPQGPDGRFIPTTLSGAIKDFAPLVGRTLIHEETGINWTIRPSDFVRFVFEKSDRYRDKANCSTEDEAHEFYIAASRGEKWTQETKGFREDRAKLIKYIPSIFGDPDVIAVGKKNTEDQGAIIVIKKLEFKRVPVLVKIPREEGKRRQYIEVGGLEVAPISNHLRREKSIRNLIRRRYDVKWHKKTRHLWIMACLRNPVNEPAQQDRISTALYISALILFGRQSLTLAKIILT